MIDRDIDVVVSARRGIGQQHVCGSGRSPTASTASSKQARSYSGNASEYWQCAGKGSTDLVHGLSGVMTLEMVLGAPERDYGRKPALDAGFYPAQMHHPPSDQRTVSAIRITPIGQESLWRPRTSIASLAGVGNLKRAIDVT